MRIETMYRLLAVTIFILLLVVSIYIGMEVFGDNKREKENIIASNTDTDKVKIYEQEQKEELEDKVMDVDVKYTDVYPDCGHTIESEEHQENTTISKVKEGISEKDLGYKLIGEQDGVLLYQKVHIGKCVNHYKVCLEKDVVTIYRMSETGEYKPYQTTDITKDMVREGIAKQLEQGIVVNDIEELFLLIEDIES